MKDPTIIGRFGRVFGIKGWLHVISFTNPKENILSYQPWWVILKENAWEPLCIIDWRQDSKSIRVKPETANCPMEAQFFVNKEIAIPSEMLPSLAENQYYWYQLEGLLVKNIQNEVLGKVDYLFETGSNDVMVVKGSKEYFIPFIDSIILHVDLFEKFILVDWDADF